MKKVLSLLLIILTLLSVTACGMIDDVINPHDCENVCTECGKCINADCQEDACADKCGGHHKCESVCAECSKCTDTTCTEYACTDKCGGHHKCESVCKECGKCTDTTCTEEACKDKCGGHHKCESVCEECNKCTDATCTEEACADKCGGHKEEVPDFPSGDYIVEDKAVVDLGNAVLNVEGKAFIKGNFDDLIKVAITTLEKVTGNKFINGKGYADYYPDGKIHINVRRETMYAEQDWYQGDPYNDYGSAYAGPYEHVVLTPGYTMSDNYTIIHELGHILMVKQTNTYYCTVLDEGYTEYSSYLVLQELEKENPAYRIDFKPSEYLMMNLRVHDYSKLYEHPIEYWFDNTFEHAANGNYAVGFRFMWYLDAVYGSYTKWLDVIDSMYDPINDDGYSLTADQKAKALKAAYGDDVMDGFYPWLKKNVNIFKAPDYTDYTKLSGAINIYPTFDAIKARIVLERIEYTDLYINLEQARYYLEEYKNFDSSNLILKVSKSDGKVPTVNLYKADGSFVTVKGNNPISLDGISYIKLVGTGKAARIEISGFTPR